MSNYGAGITWQKYMPGVMEIMGIKIVQKTKPPALVQLGWSPDRVNEV